MATLQLRVESWRVLFRYQGQQHALTLGKLPEREARLRLARTEEILLKIKQRWLEVPLGCPITEFIEHDGKPPQAKETAKTTTCGELRKRYTEVISNGSVEPNTLYTLKIHLKHIEDTLGAGFLLSGLNHNHLQNHIDRRRKKVAGVTIKKEITTFGAAWAWAARAKLVEGNYPSDGLRYPINKEPLSYMTLAEIERRIKAGGNPTELYEALYLDAKQIAQVLAHVKKQKMPGWVYPMFVLAAHSGARRAEMLRAQVADVDLVSRVITLREKKRKRSTNTTRRVPISDLLAKAIKPLLKQNRIYLFGDGYRELTVEEAKQLFWKTFKGSKWYEPLTGYHLFRHSFISALAAKAVDQRLIDEFTGHRTEAQRRRYRHLLPAVTREAIKLVFG